MLNEVFTVHLGTRALNYLCTGRHNTKATTTLANGIVLHAARNMLLHLVWKCFSDGWSIMPYSPGFLQAAAPAHEATSYRMQDLSVPTNRVQTSQSMLRAADIRHAHLRRQTSLTSSISSIDIGHMTFSPVSTATDTASITRSTYRQYPAVS